jgi:predicted nucleic acid-binding protein
VVRDVRDVGELVKGASMAGWDLRRRTVRTDWLGKVVIVPYNIRVSGTWGQLAAATRLRHRPRPVNDMWIAAVSIAHGIPLTTRNPKDFQDFEPPSSGIRPSFFTSRWIRSPGRACS